MRIHEITTIKSLKPLTPAQARINALKQQQTKAKTALNAEREQTTTGESNRTGTESTAGID